MQYAQPHSVVQIPDQEIILQGFDLILREPKPSDYPFLQQMLSDTKTMSHLMYMSRHQQGGWTLEEVEEKHSKPISKKGLGNIQFIIENKLTAQPIGTCGFNAIKKDHFRGEFFIIVHHPYWRRGVSAACHRICFEYGFENLRLNRIELVTMIDNQEMRGFLRRIGIKQESILKSAFLEGGRFKDAVMYATLKEEWPMVKQALDQVLSQKQTN